MGGENGKRLKIIRTRDTEEIKKADIVLDVGTIYDPAINRFDHHQKGGAGAHENGIPYASFGLVWKHYGAKICNEEVALIIEKRLVMPIDARDNGVAIHEQNELGLVDYRVSDVLYNFNPTLAEGGNQSFKQFKKAVKFAKEILEREIVWEIVIRKDARLTLEAIELQGNPEILVLDQRIESEEEVSKNKNIKFVASKSKESDNWSVVSARDDLEDYKSDRANFPESWRGLRDEELVRASGVEEAIFCHSGGWFLKAATKEAAITLAKKALKQYNSGVKK